MSSQYPLRRNHRYSLPADRNIPAMMPRPLSRRDLVFGASATAALAAGWGAPAPRFAFRGEIVEPTEPTRPAGVPAQGGNLVVGSLLKPDTLHPWLATNTAALDILDGVMDGLLRYTAGGRLRPALAEAFAISEDGLTYTFTLRQGVRFHNGERFSGRDVVAAWELASQHEFDALSTLGWQKVDTVELQDDETLVVSTIEPYAPFLSTVATTYVCPRAALAEGVDSFREVFAVSPIGTGPFRVRDWQGGSAIELARWDDYWGEPALLDAISYHVVSDIDTLLGMLASGEVDVASSAGGIPPRRVDEALVTPGVTIFQHTTMNWQHVDLKQMSFVRETPVRQALDFATPRQQIIDDVLSGRATPAFADQSPVSWAYNETLQPRRFNPQRAAALLDAAGLLPGDDGVRQRDGKRFEIDLWGVAGDERALATIEMIAAQWNAIGVSTLAQFARAKDLWGPLGYQFSDRMTACLFTWTNANDPDDIFYWHSSQIPISPTASGGNLPAFFYPYGFQDEIDQLTAEAASTLDFTARKQLYAEIQSLLSLETPVIFLAWEEAFPAARRDVGGFWPSAWAPLLWNAAEWYLAVPEGTPRPQ